MKDIGVIGNGKIGRAVASLLRSENFSVTVADAVAHPDCVQLDATDEKQVEHFVSDKDAIICAGPYHITKPVATVCAKLDKAYFDPTEDTEMAEYINTCTNSQTMMTQCGLAPGAVNIIACDLSICFILIVIASRGTSASILNQTSVTCCSRHF